MISEKEMAAIDAAVEAAGIENWRPLDSAERDLVRRVFAAACAQNQPVDEAS